MMSTLDGSAVLITGGVEFIGSNLCWAMLGRWTMGNDGCEQKYISYEVGMNSRLDALQLIFLQARLRRPEDDNANLRHTVCSYQGKQNSFLLRWPPADRGYPRACQHILTSGANCRACGDKNR